MQTLASLLERVLDLIAPPRATALAVRELSLEEVELLVSPTHDEGLLPYRDDRVRALVWELKYHRNTRAAELAGAIVADALVDIAQDELGSLALIPVPMHPARRKARGHNQTELLCEAALKALAQKDLEARAFFDYLPSALSRERLCQPQQELPRGKRLVNVRGSMVADSQRIKHRVCVVVDDVSTTGATLAEAERALLRAGARRVHLLALAQS